MDPGTPETPKSHYDVGALLCDKCEKPLSDQVMLEGYLCERCKGRRRLAVRVRGECGGVRGHRAGDGRGG